MSTATVSPFEAAVAWTLDGPPAPEYAPTDGRTRATGPITAGEFVDHLRRRGAEVRKTRKGWKVTCPAHLDDDPSLCVDPGDHRPVLLHCHAGCSDLEILEAAGLRLADITPFREGAPALTYRPCCGNALDEDPFLNWPNVLPVIASHEHDDHSPWTVPTPKGAGRIMRALVADLAAIATERRNRRDHRPIPYSGTFGAARLDADAANVRAALRALARHGVIAKAEPLPPTPQNPRGCPTWRITVVSPCASCATSFTGTRASAVATTSLPVAVSWGETSESPCKSRGSEAPRKAKKAKTKPKNRDYAEFAIFGERFRARINPEMTEKGTR